jgi:hypothetical protein
VCRFEARLLQSHVRASHVRRQASEHLSGAHAQSFASPGSGLT